MKYYATVNEQQLEFVVHTENGQPLISAKAKPLNVVLKAAGQPNRFLLLVDNEPHELFISVDQSGVRVDLNGNSYSVDVEDEKSRKLARFINAQSDTRRNSEVHSPMPGMVLEILASEGEQVRVGDPLLVIEAMKMENEIRSETAGTVRKVSCRKNESVDKGAILMVIE